MPTSPGGDREADAARGARVRCPSTHNRVIRVSEGHNRKNVTIVAQASAEYARVAVLNPELKAPFEEMLNESVDEFVETCGARYPSQAAWPSLMGSYFRKRLFFHR